MLVAFLDVDGVLNSENWSKRRINEVNENEILNKYPFYSFDPIAIERLNKFVNETGCKVVLSSSWRHGRTLDQVIELFKIVGFLGEIIDMTPNLSLIGMDSSENKIRYTSSRGCEIKWWVEQVGKLQRTYWSNELQKKYIDKALLKNYVIFDDDIDMLYEQKEHFIKINPYYGLTDSDINKAINIFKSDLITLYND